MFSFNFEYWRIVLWSCSGSYKNLLYEHGLLLLQGFPLGNATKFNIFLDNLDGLVQMLSKESAFRHAVDKKVKLLASMFSRRKM